MSKKSKIRWRESDLAELQRTINNYNAKLYRIKKNHPEMIDYLPERMTKTNAIKSIETRADLNRLVNSLHRFSKRGAEKPVSSTRGAKATQWEVNEFKNKQRMENARRTRERKKIENEDVKIGGKSTGQTRAQMGSVKENALKPSRKNFKNMSQKEWELASKNMDKMLNAKFRNEKNELMRENYIKGLTENGFIDDVPELEDWIRGVDFDTFFTTVETDETATFFFYKDPIAYESRKEKIVDAWRNAHNRYKGGN